MWRAVERAKYSTNVQKQKIVAIEIEPFKKKNSDANFQGLIH